MNEKVAQYFQKSHKYHFEEIMNEILFEILIYFQPIISVSWMKMTNE